MLNRSKNNFVYWIIVVLIFLEFYGRTFSILFGTRQFEIIDDVISVIILFIITIYIMKNAKIKQAILNKPLFIFLIIFLLSAIINIVAIDIALMQLRSYILMIGVYYIIVWSKISNKEIINLIKLVIILAIPIFLSAIVEYALGQTILTITTRYGIELIQEGMFRSFTLIGNPIDYSNFAIIILTIILASIIEKYKLFKINKNIFIFFFIVMFLTLFMSNSRGPIIAFILTLIIVSSLFNLISKKKLFLFSILFLIIMLLFGGTILERLTHFNIESMSTDQYRVLFFIKSIEIFLDNPLIGVGPGMYGGWVSINYSPSYIYEMYGFTTDKISSIDMFFPHLIGELGILGFISYMGFFLLPFHFFIKQYKKYHNREVKFISLSILLIIPMLLLIGWFSISLETQLVFSLYMLILGLSERYIKNIIKESKCKKN